MSYWSRAFTRLSFKSYPILQADFRRLYKDKYNSQLKFTDKSKKVITYTNGFILTSNGTVKILSLLTLDELSDTVDLFNLQTGETISKIFTFKKLTLVDFYETKKYFASYSCRGLHRVTLLRFKITSQNFGKTKSLKNMDPFYSFKVFVDGFKSQEPPGKWSICHT